MPTFFAPAVIHAVKVTGGLIVSIIEAFALFLEAVAKLLGTILRVRTSSFLKVLAIAVAAFMFLALMQAILGAPF